MARDRTAALVVIGNEILSGKVADTNSAYLAKELRALGVSLQRIIVIPDEIDVIGETVARTDVDSYVEQHRRARGSSRLSRRRP